jgi:hypothetical protein
LGRRPGTEIGNEANGFSDIEGKVARVATSKLGNERVSITNPAPIELMGRDVEHVARSGIARVDGNAAR